MKRSASWTTFLVSTLVMLATPTFATCRNFVASEALARQFAGVTLKDALPGNLMNAWDNFCWGHVQFYSDSTGERGVAFDASGTAPIFSIYKSRSQMRNAPSEYLFFADRTTRAAFSQRSTLLRYMKEQVSFMKQAGTLPRSYNAEPEITERSVRIEGWGTVRIALGRLPVEPRDTSFKPRLAAAAFYAEVPAGTMYGARGWVGMAMMQMFPDAASAALLERQIIGVLSRITHLSVDANGQFVTIVP